MDQYWSRAIDYIWQADCFQSPELLAEVVYQMSGCFLKLDCVCSSRVWNSGYLCSYDCVRAISSFHKSIRDL